MMFIILDKDPHIAAWEIPNKIKFKQLIELGQLICSAGISDVYKKIPQGKKLQEWITKNPTYTLRYYEALYSFCTMNINMSVQTERKILQIRNDLHKYEQNHEHRLIRPKTAIFRYAKEYKSIYPTDSEITIKNAIEAYKVYMEWKNYDKK